MNLGKFKVARHLFEEPHNAELLALFFGKVFPIGITWDYHGVGEYTALSSLFEPVSEGQEVPSYEVIFNRENEDSPVTFRVQKIA